MKYDDKYQEKDERMGYFVNNSPLASSVLNSIGSNMKDKALTLKEKEFIMLGIGIAIRCPDCILTHAKNCKDVGATEEEIIEVAESAVAMGGGPSIAFGSLAVDIFKNL